MFSAFNKFGKLGAIGKAIASAWSPLSLWPDGIASPGMWISPSDLTSASWQDYTGTTPVVTPGTVADSSNPVGLALDIRAGATVLTDPGNPHAAKHLGGTTAAECAGESADVHGGFGWYRVSITITTTWVGSYPQFSMSDRDSATAPLEFGTPTYTGENKTVLIWGAQLNYGPTALPYQRVNTASDYNAPASPSPSFTTAYDGMATAAFSAGTLIDGMDCMIAVRRDSAAATYLISDTASRGFFEWESGDTDRPDVGAGTPTYYVDGVACTATRGALFTALTAGDWHILEARGLDLSTWLKVEVSSLVSYRLNGARGDILLFPSTDSTEDKDAARQYLADYYGVTLP
jgi:hypothetical protein